MRTDDYTALDFDSIRARLIQLVQSAFPEWTDFEVASFGNMLLEAFAFVGDVLAYYLNAQARESRLSTATQRRNVIALARMLGYRLRSASAATAELRFSLSEPIQSDIVVRAGTVVRTEEVTQPVRFQMLSSVVIRAGEVEASAIAEHSETHAELFDARGIAELDVLLDRAPYLDGSATVIAGNGTYSEVDSLLGSGPVERHFIVLVNQNDQATIRFNQKPTGSIRVTYKTGGGASGNVESRRLIVIDGVMHDVRGRPVRLAVTNPLAASGGSERESLALAKLRVPESLRALTRTVSREDFEIHARKIPGVARALMLTSNEDAGIQENTGILYVIPSGGSVPTQALKDAVRRQVTTTYPCTLTFQVNVQDPVYRYIDVEATVWFRDGVSPEAVAARIRQNLRVLFDQVDFGIHQPEVAWSDVFNVIRDTDGIRKVDRSMTLNGVADDFRLAVAEFPVLRGVTIIDASVGGNVP